MERTVFIKDQSTSGALKEFKTSATTFGELKEQLKREIGFTDVRVVCRENRNNLELATAVLPSTDFTLFIYPLKTKAGANGYDDMSFQELRKACSERVDIHGVGGNYGSSVEMREALRKADKKAGKIATKSVSGISTTTIIAKITKLQESTISALEDIKSDVSNISISTEVIDTFKQRLEVEYNEVKALLK